MMIRIDLCRYDLRSAMSSRRVKPVPSRIRSDGMTVYFYEAGQTSGSPVVYHSISEFADFLRRRGIVFDLGNIVDLQGGVHYCTYWNHGKRLCVYDKYLEMYNVHGLDDFPY